MPLSTTERQARYRAKQRRGELRPVKVVLPLEVAIRADYLTDALGVTRTELIARLLTEEWQRRGCPVSPQREERVS